MRILVFGAGALGSVVGARLAEVHDVCLVARREHVEAIGERGLRVSGQTELCQTSLTAAVSVDELDAVDLREPDGAHAGELDGAEELPEEDPPGPPGPPDAILVTVKSYDTEEAMEALAPFRETSVFVSLQNGLGNEEIMARRAAKVLGAVINQGATLLGPGEVFHAGEGDVDLGPFHGTGVDDAEAVADAFRQVGLPARAVADIGPVLWRKVILNAAVNPLTALLGKRTGELLETRALRDAVAQVVEESVEIAAACGVAVDATEIIDWIEEVARATRDNKSSMFQDLERARRTEIDAINGALVQRAGRHGIGCPANLLLTRMVRAAERC